MSRKKSKAPRPQLVPKPKLATDPTTKAPAPAPSAAQTKMKANAAAGLVPVELTRIEELMLRSTYLQAKLYEQQYFTAREQHQAQFDRRADVRETLAQIEAANREFNEALEEIHKVHGTTTTTHVYDMGVKALLPRQDVREASTADLEPKPAPPQGATDEGEAVPEETNEEEPK